MTDLSVIGHFRHRSGIIIQKITSLVNIPTVPLCIRAFVVPFDFLLLPLHIDTIEQLVTSPKRLVYLTFT